MFEKVLVSVATVKIQIIKTKNFSVIIFEPKTFGTLRIRKLYNWRHFISFVSNGC